MKYDFCIIGSGLGGLLTAFLLSKEGKSVCILEKHSAIGGNLQSFRRGEVSFDTGMHYLGSLDPGQTLHSYWKYFGLTELPFMKMDSDGFDRISFPDAEFPLAQGFGNYRHQLSLRFPGSEEALLIWTNTLERIVRHHPLYNLELPVLPFRDASAEVPACAFIDGICNDIRNPQSAIRIPLASVLTGNSFLYAGNRFTTPLYQTALINHSFISSAWRIRGGSWQIAKRLETGILSNGGHIRKSAEIIRITRDAETFMLHLKEGEPVVAGQVVSAIHPAATLQLLDGIPVRKNYAGRILRMTNTPPVFSLYLTLKPRTFPFLNHNVHHYMTDKSLCSDLLDAKEPFQGFLLMTPPEAEQDAWARTAVVMSVCRYDPYRKWEDSRTGHRDPSYLAYKEQQANLLLDSACTRFPELRTAIASMESSTPLTWKNCTGTPEGSMYGIVKDALHSSQGLILPRSKVPGLWFTGQSVNLHGAIGVTLGAVMTCGEILGMPYVLNKIKNAL